MLVKSPIELVVGTLRPFGLRPDRTLPFAVAAAGMGQNLMSPPNVKGWPGGETWINTTTLLARKQFVDRADRAPTASPMRRCDGRDGDRRAAGIARRARKRRRCEARDFRASHFDSARFLAQFPGATADERARWARAPAAAAARRSRAGDRGAIRSRSCAATCSTPPIN